MRAQMSCSQSAAKQVIDSRMNIRQAVSDLLHQMPDAGILLDIHEGRVVPLLTDYYLQPVTESWNSPPPPDSVDGRHLVPAFVDGDFYMVYCIEPASGRFLAIDVEETWPPKESFASCTELKKYLFWLATANETEPAKRDLQALLGLADADLKDGRHSSD